MSPSEWDSRAAFHKRLSTECPAGGPHEIVQVLVTPEYPEVPIVGRICRKCGLRDTYIREG